MNSIPTEEEKKKKKERWRNFIFFKLGITHEDMHLTEVSDFSRNEAFLARGPRIGPNVSRLLEAAIHLKLGLDMKSPKDFQLSPQAAEDLIDHLGQWAKKDKNRQELLSKLVLDALRKPVSSSILNSGEAPNFQRENSMTKDKPSHPGPAFQITINLSNDVVDTESKDPQVSGQASGPLNPQRDEPPLPASKLWKYIPVPEGLDEHTEFFEFADNSFEGLRILGARVRGKKHKHEGTNCDDWFEIGKAGHWTFFAVSDGAGSYQFSRVGAKVSCKAAIQSMSETLKDHRLTEREKWTAETFARDPQTGAFTEPDLEKVQEALHKAILDAFDSVKKKTAELDEKKSYFKFLGRDLIINDLSATMLIAAHVSVRYKEQDYSFILACQVGDGMTAAIDKTGNLQLLGVADSGQFSGETEFLTSNKKREKANLVGKTYPFFCPLDAMFIMTDGVADDYFPNDPGIRRLYADLILNGVIKAKSVSPQAIADALEKTKLPTLEDVRKAEFHSLIDTIEKTGSRKIKVRSAELYAEKLGLPLEAVLASTPLLAAGAANAEAAPICTELNREIRLKTWLDTYHVRASFDDRSLVIMYQENRE